MAETIRPVDAEAVVITALGGLGVPVSVRVPSPRPASHVRVTRAGGGRRNTVQSDVNVIVECWAASSSSAFALAASAWGALASIAHTTVSGAWVGPVDLTEPVNFPDPDTSSPRYQFIVTLRTGLKITSGA